MATLKEALYAWDSTVDWEWIGAIVDRKDGKGPVFDEETAVMNIGRNRVPSTHIVESWMRRL